VIPAVGRGLRTLDVECFNGRRSNATMLISADTRHELQVLDADSGGQSIDPEWAVQVTFLDDEGKRVLSSPFMAMRHSKRGASPNWTFPADVTINAVQVPRHPVLGALECVGCLREGDLMRWTFAPVPAHD
jgi:hypothetical protein